jgi:hypothetical protein
MTAWTPSPIVALYTVTFEWNNNNNNNNNNNKNKNNNNRLAHTDVGPERLQAPQRIKLFGSAKTVTPMDTQT